MLLSAGLAAARRVLTSSGAVVPLRQSGRLVPRGFILRYALPSVRMISISASMRAAKATKPKSKSTKSAKKTTTAKKATAKKATTKKTTKKTAAKSKAKPKSKKVVKKTTVKKPKKAKKKTLTPEEAEKAEIRKLKKMSLLKGPTYLPETAWNVYIGENVRKEEGSLGDRVKVMAASFRNISESEKTHLTSAAQANKATNAQMRKDWIMSYPPEAIHAANLARRRLARKSQKSRVYIIHDDRVPARANSAFNLFIKHQLSQNDTEPSRDAFRTAIERWKSCNESEKAPYIKQAAEKSKGTGEKLKMLREKGNKYWKEKLASPSASASAKD